MKSLQFSRYPQIWLAAITIWLLPAFVFGLASLIFGYHNVVFSAFDGGVLVFFFLGGFCLILQRKIFWFVSIAILFLVAIANLYRSSVLAGQMETFDYQFMLSSGVLLSIGLISYYYRFPYLDSRDTGLFGIAHRFTAQMPAQLDQKHSGQVISVSISGVLFRLQDKIEGLEVGDRLKLSVADLALNDIAVEVRGILGDRLRLKFIWLGFSQFRNLKARLQTLPMEKGSEDEAKIDI